MFLTKSFITWVALPTFVCALSSKVGNRAPSVCTEAVTLDATKNIWLNYTLHPQDVYRTQYLAAANLINDTEQRERALRVADSGTFLWM